MRAPQGRLFLAQASLRRASERASRNEIVRSSKGAREKSSISRMPGRGRELAKKMGPPQRPKHYILTRPALGSFPIRGAGAKEEATGAPEELVVARENKEGASAPETKVEAEKPGVVGKGLLEECSHVVAVCRSYRNNFL